MVERKFPLSKKQGTVLSSVGMTPEDEIAHREYIGVSFEDGEKERIIEEMISQGYLVKKDGTINLTDESKDLVKRFDIIILKED